MHENRATRPLAILAPVPELQSAGALVSRSDISCTSKSSANEEAAVPGLVPKSCGPIEFPSLAPSRIHHRATSSHLPCFLPLVMMGSRDAVVSVATVHREASLLLA
jgi:hypothetical protein